ncbi:hypothetical protein ACF0H5_020278 [Mactra antiquata]
MIKVFYASQTDTTEILDKSNIETSSTIEESAKTKEIKQFEQKNEEASSETDDLSKTASSKMTQIMLNQAPSRKAWFLYITILLWLLLLGVVLLLGGVHYKNYSDVPVLKLSFPNKKHVRHIRSYSETPSIKDVNFNTGNDPSSALITRLQIVDLTSTCHDNLTNCKTHALCERSTPNEDMKCRCNRGFYLKDLTCTPCSKTCQDGFYMTKQCGGTTDVQCKPCTQCEGRSYEVATCTSTQDTICIDVTFPLKQFQSRSHSLKDLVNWNVSLSKNVFLERLQAMKWIETPLYVTNNKQALQFIWRRPNSGLEIHVKVTEVYLIPEYIDIDHLDDEDYIKNASIYPKDITDQLLDVKHENCRHPLPDEYDLNLEIARNEATVAWEHPCDSKNSSLRPCPKGYNDGDLYVFKRLDIPCPKLNTTGNKNFGKSPNTVLCVGENDLLTKIFGSIRVADTSLLTFPTEECLQSEKQCLKCLQSNSCSRDTNGTDCCNLQCHQTSECKQHFSDTCPVPPIQCTRGDVSKFGIMPRLPSILKQFSCHLEHLPPKYLYQLAYEVKIPRMQFTLGTRIKDVLYKNFTDHQNGQDSADFLSMSHHTASKYDDEVILTGTFNNSDPTRIRNYRLHKLKQSADFTDRLFNVVKKGKDKYLTKIQFEKPFLSSTANWWEDGCYRNASQIIPSQPIYETYGKSVMQAVKHKRKDGKFVYQIQTEDAMPHMRFKIKENTSIFSYYRDEYKDVRINPWSLHGDMIWDKPAAVWNISLSGSLTACPGIFTLEIFTENLNTRLAVYDMLVNCPKNFSTGFQIRRNNIDFVDIFIIVMNDSVSSYRTVLSSVQGPQYFRADPKNTVAMEMGKNSPWLTIIVILLACVCASFILTILYMYCNRKNSKHIPTDINVPKPDLGPQITLLQSMDKVTKDDGLRMKTKCVMLVLAVLYIVYAFMFTFTAVFGLFHLFQMSGLNQVTLVTNTSAQVQIQMQRSLDQITQYENDEMARLLSSTEQRLKACSYHLKTSLHDNIPNGNTELQVALQNIFKRNGTIRQSLADYFVSKQDFYQKEVDKFLKEFDKTLDAKLHKIQLKYSAYLKSVASNDWFLFPKEIFMHQQVISGEPLSKVTDNLTGFLTWLEIDKVQEIFEMKEIVMNRLLTRMPKVDFSNLIGDVNEDMGELSTASVNFKPVNNTFKFVSNKPDYKQTWREYNPYAESDSDNRGDNSRKFTFSDIKGYIYPVFICVFLVLDSFLIIYRLSWLTRCWGMFKTGLEERIPYDSMTRKIFFILTGKEVPRPEDSLDHPYDYYMHNKENIWDDNTEMYFLYCNSSTKNKEDILRDIWAHRQRQNPKPEVKKEETNCFQNAACKLTKCIYRFFISPVSWRLVLICGFLLILCLFAKATNDLVTVESAMFLLDTDAMIPILKRQNQMTNAVIEQYGFYLNKFIQGYKTAVDGDVQLINNLMVNVAERQTLLLSTMISDMCNLVGRQNCDVDINLVSMSLTSCNFLPIYSKPFEGFHETILKEYIQSELSPLVQILRQILFNSIYLLLIYSSGMILCQVTARVIFVHLKNSRHMKMTKVFQLPSIVDQWQERNSFREKEIYNSQSVIAESCESGVYDIQ